MKALDYLLIICAVALFVASHFAVNADLKLLLRFCAMLSAAFFGAHLGGTLRKKNSKQDEN